MAAQCLNRFAAQELRGDQSLGSPPGPEFLAESGFVGGGIMRQRFEINKLKASGDAEGVKVAIQ